MGNHPPACIVADAQNLPAIAHLPVRRVVKHVAFELPRRRQRESRIDQAATEAGHVVHCELDLGLDCRHNQ